MIESEIPPRILEQIRWYDDKSVSCQRSYKNGKLLQLVASAAIPVVGSLTAIFQSSPWLEHVPIITASVLGFALVILEGVQQMNGYHQLWLQYRATNEALRREVALCQARAGIYRDSERPIALLVERAETIMSQEQSGWVENMRAAASGQSAPSTNESATPPAASTPN